MVIFKKNGSLVYPCSLLAEGNYKTGIGVYRENNRFFSSFLGYFKKDYNNTLNVVPIKSVYVPVVGDIVIGKIIEIGISSWTVDINSPYNGILQLSETISRPIDLVKTDLREILNIGDIIIAKVIVFDLTRDPLLTIKESRLGRVREGYMLELSKEEKLSERKIKDIEEKFKCNIVVGKNKRLLIIPKKNEKALSAIEYIIKNIERGRFK